MNSHRLCLILVLMQYTVRLSSVSVVAVVFLPDTCIHKSTEISTFKPCPSSVFISDQVKVNN